MTRILGLDLSLVTPGIALKQTGQVPHVVTLHLPSVAKPRKAVEADPGTSRRKARKALSFVPFDLPARVQRLRTTREHIRETIGRRSVDLAVMERMYVDRKSDDLLERAWVWGIVAEDLLRLGIPVAMVPPSNLKMYATGDPKASKQDMLRTAQGRYPDAEIEDHNSADALWLAEMGWAYMDRNLACVADYQLRAIEGSVWPEMLSDDVEVAS